MYCKSDSKALMIEIKLESGKSPCKCSLCGSKFAQKEWVKALEKKNDIEEYIKKSHQALK